MLLTRMICLREQRISSAEDILLELSKIEAWEKSAELIPMSAAARVAVEKLQRRSIETARMTEENKQARQQEDAALGAAQKSVTEWLTGELEKIGSMVASDSIKCTVQAAAVPNNLRIQTGHNSMYRVLNGVELIFDDLNDPRNCTHSLQFFLCEHHRSVVTVSVGPPRPLMPAAKPARDPELAVVVLYRRSLKHQHPQNHAVLGYLSRPQMVGQTRGRWQQPAPGSRKPPTMQNYRVLHTMSAFEPDVALHCDFQASQWPLKEEDVRSMLEQASETFFTKAVV